MRIPPYSPPQRIDRAASPTFANLTLTALAAAGILAADGSGVFGAVPAKTANTVYAGPVSGGVAAPAFRALVIADLPFAGQVSGVATLDSGGKIPSAQLPSIALTDTFVVASQAAMLALSAERGDVAIRTDLNKSFVLATDSPGTLADWKELLTPTDAVLSVAGLTGAISDSGLRTALGLGYFATGTDAANLTGTVAAARLTGASYSFTTPVLGVATATSVAIAGASIGSNALAWTGTANGSGNLTIGGVVLGKEGSAASVSYSFGGSANTGFYGSSETYYSSGGTIAVAFTTTGVRVGADGLFAWRSTDAAGAADVILRRDAANTLALRNGVNAQTARVYGTWTDASNGDWLNITKAAGGAATISTAKNGSGTAGDLNLTATNVIHNGVSKHTGNVWLDNALVTGLTPSVSAGLLTKSIIIYDSAGAAITLYGS